MSYPKGKTFAVTVTVTFDHPMSKSEVKSAVLLAAEGRFDAEVRYVSRHTADRGFIFEMDSDALS